MLTLGGILGGLGDGTRVGIIDNVAAIVNLIVCSNEPLTLVAYGKRSEGNRKLDAYAYKRTSHEEKLSSSNHQC